MGVTFKLNKMQVGLIIFIQFLILQNVLSKEITLINENTEFEENVSNALILSEFKEQRGITDIWNNIKNSAKNAWNALKKLAQNTKEKIQNWIRDVKDRAVAIAKSFEERLKALKSKICNAIQNILGDEDVRKCFQAENEKIDAILIDIVQYVTTCISKKINDLKVLEDYKKLDTLINDSDFMDKVDAKLNNCNQKEDQIEQCLQNVREDILKETENAEEIVLNDRLASRSFTDYILDAVITCSTDGLIQASAVIMNEVLIIIKCVTGGSP